MKKSSFLLFILTFSFFINSVFTQIINEKLVTALPQLNGYVDAYSLKYDHKTGGWIYGAYDTTSRTYTLVSSKGSSIPFNYVMQYYSLFDDEGNAYTLASSNVTDTTSSYSIVKNNEVIATYDNIQEGWVMKNGLIYYAASEAGKSNLFIYDTKAGTFSKGKSYDEVRLVYNPLDYSEGEPVGYVGFTSAGSPYYVARDENMSFLVIGTDEQKKYADISWYDMKTDPSGNLCYIAKSSGSFYVDRGNTFIVQGDKEYRSFDWVYGPIEFSPSGEPVYAGQDSIGEYKYKTTLMIGSDPVKTIEGSIYNYIYSPSGKFAYITSTDYQDKNGDYIYSSNLVYDGKESKTYSSINFIKFTSSDKPVFVASDKKYKSFIIMEGKQASEKYDYISDFAFLPKGKLAYVGTAYGNYEKKVPDKSYVYIGDEKFGPYNIVSTADWKTGSQLLTDAKGNYAFIAGQNIDYDNYIYKYWVVSSKFETKKFDNVLDLKLVNGKFLYLAGMLVQKDLYIYDYNLYIDNKQVGDTYSAYSDLTVDDSGVVTFLASKGSNMYWVEVKP
jgi:hypothetical protein